MVLAAVAYRLALFVVTPLVWGAVRLGKRRQRSLLPDTDTFVSVRGRLANRGRRFPA